MAETEAAGGRSPLAVDIASVATCSLIWGTTWFVITLQLGAVPPLQSVVYRFALASALLFGWCAITRRPVALTRAQHLQALAQGLFNFTIQYSLVYLAERTVASGAMAVIFAAVAFVNLIVFRVLLGVKAPPVAWAGTLLGLAGVAVMSASQLLAAHRAGAAAGSAVGVAMAVAGVLAAVFGNLFASRAQAAGAPVATGTAWAMGYGAALLAVFVTLTGQPWRFDPSVRYVGSLLYLALLGSVTAFVVYYSLARRRGYTFASYVAALAPPTAMLISSLFEGAHWGFTAIAGVLLVLAGQALLIRSPRR